MQYPVPPVRIRLTALPELSELLEAFTRAGYLAVQAGRDVIESANKPGPHRRPAAGHDAALETFPPTRLRP